MENTFNIILRMMKNDGPVIGATLAAIFLLLVVMIVLRRRRTSDAESDVVLVKNPAEIDMSMDDTAPDLAVSAPATEPTPMPDLDMPVLAGELADENADPTLEMTRELDGGDTVGKLAPEHAFSIEITDTEPDPSLIAPNFAADPVAPEPDADATDAGAGAPGDDDISIPRQGATEAKSGRFGIFGNSWLSRKEAAPTEGQTEGQTGDETETGASGELGSPVEHQGEQLGEHQGGAQIEAEANAVTPDAIAVAVADLVGDSQAALATATAATTEVADSDKAAASLTIARAMDEAGVIDEIEHLAEVERKMRALRELFQAGLIAPEVYLLKAREYASESL